MDSTPSRSEICTAAAGALRSAKLDAFRAVVGFDGMVDTIARAVDRRTGPDAFQPMRDMGAFARRVSDNAGTSINIELRVERVKVGGNGAILADALASAGARVTFVGGIAGESGGVHEVFREFAARCERACPTSPPGFTDAVEFEDGKVMLGKTAVLADITWARVLDACGGADAFVAMLDGAALLAPESWTMVPHMNGIWAGLARDALPRIAPERRPGAFIDLADPAKRSDEEVRGALELLRELQGVTDVALGLNLGESRRIASIVGAPAPSGIDDAARTVRSALGLSCVVAHRREGSAASWEGGDASFDGAFVKRPRMSTGAGDHFNAGFSLAWRLGLPVPQALAVGSGVSGLYVRSGESPSLTKIVSFLSELPEPER